MLELALREALSLGQSYIGTEHILLGLVRELGDRDRVIPLPSLRRSAKAVRPPKRVRRFRAGHALTVRALYERLEWLDDVRAIKGPPVAGGPHLTPRGTR